MNKVTIFTNFLLNLFRFMNNNKHNCVRKIIFLNKNGYTYKNNHVLCL